MLIMALVSVHRNGTVQEKNAHQLVRYDETLHRSNSQTIKRNQRATLRIQSYLNPSLLLSLLKSPSPKWGPVAAHTAADGLRCNTFSHMRKVRGKSRAQHVVTTGKPGITGLSCFTFSNLHKMRRQLVGVPYKLLNA